MHRERLRTHPKLLRDRRPGPPTPAHSKPASNFSGERQRNKETPKWKSLNELAKRARRVLFPMAVSIPTLRSLHPQRSCTASYCLNELGTLNVSSLPLQIGRNYPLATHIRNLFSPCGTVWYGRAPHPFLDAGRTRTCLLLLVSFHFVCSFVLRQRNTTKQHAPDGAPGEQGRSFFSLHGFSPPTLATHYASTGKVNTPAVAGCCR